MPFCFGNFEADEEAFELRRSGTRVPVQRRVLETIFFLVRRRDRLVTKQDLIDGPWGGVSVGDGALNQAIMLARRALASEGPEPIVTVRGKGFRFVAPVHERGGVERPKTPAEREFQISDTPSHRRWPAER